MGGLGAFLEPCRAGLAAEAQKCTPEVAKLAQLGGILEVKLGLKSQKKIDRKFIKFLVVSRSAVLPQGSLLVSPRGVRGARTGPRRGPASIFIIFYEVFCIGGARSVVFYEVYA